MNNTISITLKLLFMAVIVGLVIKVFSDIIQAADRDHLRLIQQIEEAKQGKLIFDKDGVKVYRIHDYKDHWICISSNSVSIQE